MSKAERDRARLLALREKRGDLFNKIAAGKMSIRRAWELGRRGRGQQEFIYFIQSIYGGPVKVGCSADPEYRLRQLQLCCPFKLELHGYVTGSKKDEKRLHRKMRKHRAWGEWFHPNEYLSGLLRALNTLKRAKGQPEVTEMTRPES